MTESDDGDGDRQKASSSSRVGNGTGGTRRQRSSGVARKAASSGNARKAASSGDARKAASSRDARKSAPPSPAKLAQRACTDLAELIGREVEGIVSLERSDDGWCFGVEVLETARIPNTADVLAEYEVNADRHGRLVGYHRVRRYTRGSTRDAR